MNQATETLKELRELAQLGNRTAQNLVHEVDHEGISIEDRIADLGLEGEGISDTVDGLLLCAGH